MGSSKAAYRRARREFLREDPNPNYFMVLTVSAVLFAVAARRGVGWHFGVALMLVLLVHEAGHAIAMRCVGYRNVRIFFLPFFGAITTGFRSRAIQATSEAVVLLAGPAPGLLLGIALRGAHFTDPALRLWVHVFSRTLIWVNAFNLLPMVPLDGGRLVGLAVVGRRAALEALFALASGVALSIWAIRTRAWALLAVGFAVVVVAFTVEREAEIANSLRKRHGVLAADPADLDEEESVDLYVGALGIVERRLPAATRRNRRKIAKIVARTMRSIQERASVPEATMTARALILASYAAALAAFVVFRP